MKRKWPMWRSRQKNYVWTADKSDKRRLCQYDQDEDFYEEDEDPEMIWAAFERGEKGLTAPPDGQS